MEATETAQNQTDATPVQAEVVNLLGDTAKIETTPQTDQVQEPAKVTETVVEGAPEKYEFKAPEGKEYDPAILSAFEATARELNLTQDAAQKQLDKMQTAFADKQIAQTVALRDSWTEASRTDKDFGGEKLQQSLGLAKKGLDQFASPELKHVLSSTGLGNHPEVIRYFLKVGQAISEDKFVIGGNMTSSSKSAADVLYDNTPKG